MASRLGVDARQADQNIRGTVDLPYGTGKSVRVVVFAQGDPARQAEEAGADFVGTDELVDKIADGWLDFDATIATPGFDAQYYAKTRAYPWDRAG